MTELAISLPNTEGITRPARRIAYGAAVLAAAGLLATSCDETGGGGLERGPAREAYEWGGSYTWKEPPEGSRMLVGPGLAVAAVVHEAIREAMDGQ